MSVGHIYNKLPDFKKGDSLVIDTKVLVDQLIRFGLTSRQAEVYIFLLGNAPTVASQIARQMGINRSDTYRILGDLFELGLVEKHLSRPRKTLFKPAPPKEAISRILDIKKGEIDELSKRAEEVANWLNSIKKDMDERAQEPTIFKIIGERGIFDALENMFRRAKQEIGVVLGSRDLSLWLVRGMDDVLENMAKRGINIRIITNIDKGNLDEVKRINTFCHIKHTEDLLYHASIVDGKEVIIGAPLREALEKDHYNAYVSTNEKGLVDTLKDSFERMWDTSITANDKINSLR